MHPNGSPTAARKLLNVHVSVVLLTVRGTGLGADVGTSGVLPRVYYQGGTSRVVPRVVYLAAVARLRVGATAFNARDSLAGSGFTGP